MAGPWCETRLGGVIWRRVQYSDSLSGCGQWRPGEQPFARLPEDMIKGPFVPDRSDRGDIQVSTPMGDDKLLKGGDDTVGLLGSL